MSIWTQKSASIQPRTSLLKIWLGVFCRRASSALSCAASIGQTLEGSFSAVSTPIFATKYSFCSIFRDLQNELAEFSKFGKNFRKKLENCKKSESHFDNLVDLEKSFKNAAKWVFGRKNRRWYSRERALQSLLYLISFRFYLVVRHVANTLEAS